MPPPILATKLYIPPLRPNAVRRPRLVERLNGGLSRKLTLISAAAGFGKTSLLAEWASHIELPIAWLSLDEDDKERVRFLAYLIAALQTISPALGQGVLAGLSAPQPPPLDAILTTLLNEIAALPHPFVLVLDDYHTLDSPEIDEVLAFLLKYLPPSMHLVLATREDPSLPLAQLRAGGHLTELRAADLRFTYAEAAEFLKEAMGLHLAPGDIAALEKRTEGWITGLQLAALSLQGQEDVEAYIHSFTGSNRFVLDYLVDEVLHQQPPHVQSFLLHTSILSRLCGPLCDAVLGANAQDPDAQDPDSAPAEGQEILHALERANLFLVPLDGERRWYRYHHLFGDLLRQRLQQEATHGVLNQVHVRASQWFEDNDLDLEAFQHAVAAEDLDRAARLVEGKTMPLHFRGSAVPVLSWLDSLPRGELDARPALWVNYASALIFVSRLAGVEEKLQAAETAMQGAEYDARTRNLIGHIAAIRATLAVAHHQVETIVAQSSRALEYLDPDNLPVRTATTWTLAYAYHLQGNRAAAAHAYAEAQRISQAIGHYIIHIMASIGLGNIQEADTDLKAAALTYRDVLQLTGEPPLPVACAAHLGLARIHYEWNDLPAARRHAEQSVLLARQLDTLDRVVAGELFLSRLQLAEGDKAGAAATLLATEGTARRQDFVHRLPDIAAAQVLLLLSRGQVEAAARTAQTHDIPLSLAHVHLARGDPAAALGVLAPLRAHAEERQWRDALLQALNLQALALAASGEEDRAMDTLAEALAMAEPGGFVRLFVDEGPPMAQLLAAASERKLLPLYVTKLLGAFAAADLADPSVSPAPAHVPADLLPEALSARELEILQLIAQGLSNQEIGDRLFLALDTVKGHNRRIFDKLQVQRRTEAVAKARALQLLPADL